MRKTITLFLTVFIAATIIAQSNRTAILQPANGNQKTNRCATYEKTQKLMQNDPQYAATRALIEQQTQQWIANHANYKAPVVVTIPVVVHVVWRTSAGNLSDARIQEQIDVLNEDYRRLNADASNTPSGFTGVAADTEIEFCLATEDPNGSPTNGIVRVQTSTQNIGGGSGYYQSSQGGSNIWNRNSYLNIWVCEIGGGTLGFAYTPGAPASYDGVVIGYQYFGKTGASFPFNKGRTTTHEVGHWLNLRHIWGDDGTSCSGSDNVSDTPNQAGPTYGCPSYPNTDACSSSSPGIMYMNYMDYSDDNCMNIFTSGQKSRMQATLNGTRSSLKNSTGCSGTVANLNADFSASLTTITEGSSITFTDLSTGSPTTWSWTFNNGSPNTSSSQTPGSITYNTAGTYDVSLTISDGTTSDTETKAGYITVLQAGASICDTVSNYNTATNTAALYVIGVTNNCGGNGWGYVAGHNCYDDRAKADMYTGTPGDTIKGAIISFGKAYGGSSGSTIDVKVWDGTSGTPGTVLTTETVSISQLSITQSVAIMFSTPAVVSGDFFVGIEWAANGTPQDTVVIVTNTDGETSPGTGWELWNDGTWHDYATSWTLNVSHAIWVIKCAGGGSPCTGLNASATATSASCSGAQDGTASANASGGTAPYTYLWANGQTTSTATGLSAGSYNVTITDANNCTTTASATVSAGTGGPSATTTSTNATCNGGNDGSATLTASGGTSPYTYSWQNGQTGTTATGLVAGTYTVTVTDANGCQGTTTASVSEPTAVSGTATSTDATCGSNDGSATATGTGGASPYTYLWPNFQTGTTAIGLTAGNYAVTVTDANGCTGTIIASVSNANAPTISVTGVDASSFGTCDGSASVATTGGTPPYNYQWSTGEITDTIAGLCAGTYNLTVSDSAGCIAVSSIIISEPVGIVSHAENFSVNIFPNPTNGAFKIEIQNTKSEKSEIKVYNMLGEAVYQKSGVENQQLEIDLSGHPAGFYFVQIQIGESSIIRKVSLIK